MGKECNTNGGEEECMQDVDGKARKKDHKEDQGGVGWIILKWILNGFEWYGLDCSDSG
jgi:hypothetical protein